MNKMDAKEEAGEEEQGKPHALDAKQHGLSFDHAPVQSIYLAFATFV